MFEWVRKWLSDFNEWMNVWISELISEWWREWIKWMHEQADIYMIVHRVCSMLASALLPPDTRSSNSPFHLCRLFLNHLGYMTWEKRSAGSQIFPPLLSFQNDISVYALIVMSARYFCECLILQTLSCYVPLPAISCWRQGVFRLSMRERESACIHDIY